MDTSTPLAAQIIERITKHEGQEPFAKRCGLARQTVTLHVTGKRSIRDDHLAAYLSAVGPDTRRELLGAWLRDITSSDVQTDIFDPDTMRLQETVTNWRPHLDAEANTMLDWWADALAVDPELCDIFRQISRKAGYPAEVQRIAGAARNAEAA